MASSSSHEPKSWDCPLCSKALDSQEARINHLVVERCPNHHLFPASLEVPGFKLVPSRERIVVESPCTICRTPNAKACEQCKSAAYCSHVCQETDWPLHKMLCRKMKELAPRPSQQHKLSLRFPVEGEPELVWVEFDRGWASDPDDFEQVADHGICYNWVHCNYFRNHRDVDQIHVECVADFRKSEAKVNGAILKATNGRARGWKGPVWVRMNRDSEDRGNTFFSNITLTDFRNVVDYFNCRADSLFFGKIGEGAMVKGVIAHCDGDIKAGSPKYTPVSVPLDHPIFDENDKPILPQIQRPGLEFDMLNKALEGSVASNLSGISSRIGVPVLTRRTFVDEGVRNGSVGGITNEVITFLHLESDPKSEKFGWAPFQWQNDVGNVLIVRKDKKDLTVNQVKALMAYNWDVIKNAFEVCNSELYEEEPPEDDEDWEPSMEKDTEPVMALMTEEKFREYCYGEFLASSFEGLNASG